MRDATALTVLGYSEEAFPEVEQRFMTNPRIRDQFVRLYSRGAVRWWAAADWRDYDAILAWRGTPQAVSGSPQYHWMCQNLNHRQHRYNLVVGMIERDWLSSSRISYGNQSIPWDDCECGRYHYDEVDTGKNPIIRQLVGHFDEDPRYADPVWRAVGTVEMPAPPVHIWEQTAVNIVTETDKSTPHPTEKTWQAVLYGRPVIVWSGAGHVAGMRDQGYVFGDNVLDHSYDDIGRGQDRLKKIFDTMESVRSWQPEELYSALSVGAEHNQRLLIQRIAHTVLPKPVKLMHRGWASENALRLRDHAQRVIKAAQACLP